MTQQSTKYTLKNEFRRVDGKRERKTKTVEINAWRGRRGGRA